MKLLCTFSTENELKSDIYTISQYNEQYRIYSNLDDSTEFFIIHNLIENNNIIVRQKKYNTIFFTINSLNKLVEFHNNYSVPRKQYADKMILSRNDVLEFIPIKIFENN